jgi:MFS family permease
MSSAVEHPAIDPRANRVVTFVFITVFLDMIGFGVIIPLLPFYVRSMGGNAETVGTLLGCFSATQLVMTPILGRLSDRLGRRRVILVSLLGNAISMAVFALAAERKLLPLLFISRIVAGATAGNLSACQAAVADVTPPHLRAQRMGVIGAGIGLGMVLGPVLGSFLSHYGSWAPPLAAGAFAALDLLGALVYMPETLPIHARGNAGASEDLGLARGLRVAISRPKLRAVLAMYFLVFLAITNLQVALPLFADARFHWKATEVGHVFGLLGGASLFVQAAVIGPLSRRVSDSTLIAIGAAMLASGFATIAAATAPLVLLVGVTFVGLALGLANPGLAALAARLAPDDARGAVLGVAQSCGGLARTIGPVWSGFLFARVTHAAPFVGGAVAGGLATLLAIANAKPRGERRGRPRDES